MEIRTKFHGMPMKVSFDDPKEISDQDHHHAVAAAMIKYGGSFANSLGHTLLHSDSVNTRKIKEAFSLEWNQYAAMAGDRSMITENTEVDADRKIYTQKEMDDAILIAYEQGREEGVENATDE